MFIYNLKLNGSKTYKILLGIFLTIICLMILYICYSLVIKNNFKTNDEMPVNEINEINSSNYTNVLKNVNDNLDSYIGQKIKFTGFVYRIYDFEDNQFVLARNMIISSNYQSVVVGFLCTHPNAKNFEDNTWVEIEGEITKGNYHSTIPIIQVNKIEKTNPPSDEYVYPPDNGFVTTSTVL